MELTRSHVHFKAARSGKPGGQNADRRATKVHLFVPVGSLPFSERERAIIRKKFAHHINHEDELWLENQETRSQELNKDKALEHLNRMLREALTLPKPRIPTEPPAPLALEAERIHEKKLEGRKRRARRPVPPGEVEEEIGQKERRR